MPSGSELPVAAAVTPGGARISSSSRCWNYAGLRLLYPGESEVGAGHRQCPRDSSRAMPWTRAAGRGSRAGTCAAAPRTAPPAGTRTGRARPSAVRPATDPLVCLRAEVTSRRAASRAGAIETSNPTAADSAKAKAKTPASGCRSNGTGRSTGRAPSAGRCRRPPCQQRAERSARDRQQHGFGDELPRDAAAAGADRRSQRDLGAAIRAAGQQQARQVEASGEQQQAAQPHHAPGDGPRRPAERVAEHPGPGQPHAERRDPRRARG